MKKKDFPIFATQPNLVYLDSAATSLKPKCVIDAVAKYYSEYSANIHRGIYDLSERATEAYENVRTLAKNFLNARSEKEIIFTRGTTEGINLVARTWGAQNLRSGDEILLSIMEHHSNIVPWQMIARAKNAVIKFVEINKDGTLDMKQLSKLLTKRTRIVSITAVSNSLGTINPIKLIVQKAHAVGAKVLVDAAQGAPHMPIDVQHLDCDFLVLSGHKMCGPTGVGVLYVREKILEKMEPLFGGGDMIREVYRTHAKWNDLPYRFEAGTPPIAEVIGLGEAIKYLQIIGMNAVREHEKKILKYAIKTLGKIQGVTMYGPLDPEIQSGVLSFNVDGVHGHDIADIFNDSHVAVRAGHHCTMPLMEVLKVPATVRASFYIYSTKEDVDKLAKAIKKVKKIFS
jgi:cysteine desulfurase/selenocysteine lyase